MAKDSIISVEMSESDARQFFTFFNSRAKEKFLPVYLGVKTIEFSLQIAEKGFVIFIETNRQLNDSTIRWIRHWSSGFLDGWNDHQQ